MPSVPKWAGILKVHSMEEELGGRNRRSKQQLLVEMWRGNEALSISVAIDEELETPSISKQQLLKGFLKLLDAGLLVR
ncbi:hypothetical protein L1887_16403 [Cichorium endivia]|nr:hypothetical protein L1887_16403 [Cichorium endivia]